MYLEAAGGKGDFLTVSCRMKEMFYGEGGSDWNSSRWEKQLPKSAGCYFRTVPEEKGDFLMLGRYPYSAGRKEEIYFFCRVGRGIS